MARPTNRNERRLQIAEALLSVMASEGFERASIGRIARSAGLTPGLVHYHFSTKREILVAAVEVLGGRYQERLRGALSAAATDATSQLEAFLDFHLGVGRWADSEALACWIFVSGEALRDADVQASYEAVLSQAAGMLLAIVEQGCAANEFECHSPQAAAGALLATIQGYFVMGAAARRLVPPGSALPAARQMSAGLLSAPTLSPKVEGT